MQWIYIKGNKEDENDMVGGHKVETKLTEFSKLARTLMNAMEEDIESRGY